ncbi:MAG: NADH-quinone oxidoreductase subunit J [Bdellovibrionales bacterium]|nr:NADH-quinone oxidoreductase subunit J [Bdellovibrionales bacterium]
MTGSMIAFAAFSTIAIVGSLLVIFRRTPVASAFALVLVFFSFSGLYALMGAHLIAALQILVYTGAIMVLFVFVIMLLNQDSPITDIKESSLLFKGIAGLACVGMVTVLINAALRVSGLAPTNIYTDQKIEELGGNLRVISELLFTDHLFQFELTSFLLLGAIVATIALSKRQRKGGVS